MSVAYVLCFVGLFTLYLEQVGESGDAKKCRANNNNEDEAHRNEDGDDARAQDTVYKRNEKKLYNG